MATFYSTAEDAERGTRHLWLQPKITSMRSRLDWRHGLSPGIRFDNVQSIQAGIQKAAEVSRSNAQSAAFAAETEAYNNSTSRDGYDSVCNALSAVEVASKPTSSPSAPGLGVTIGPYESCHHIATGLISEIYQSTGLVPGAHGSQAVALKIITETRNIEPHNPSREVKILHQISHPSIIELIETSKDDDGRLILVFPYKPFTLENVTTSGSLKPPDIYSIFMGLFSALTYLHDQDVIHRDIKPSNILLASPSGPAYLADFGTAWHPVLSTSDEPADHKVLEVGTGSYRAPEALFGNRSYNTSLDMWAIGTVLAECLRTPPKPLFESRDSAEDGNQLGLILSIFKTLGTPTKESWPEAVYFSTPPFEWYQDFDGHTWHELLPDVPWRDLVGRMVRYESGDRLDAKQAHGLFHDGFLGFIGPE